MTDSKNPFKKEEDLEDLLARRLGLQVRKQRPEVERESTEPSDRACFHCFVGDRDTFLEPCKLCKRLFCPDHGFRANWGRFCTQSCSQTYFYGSEDEIDPDDIEGGQYTEDE